MRINVVAAACFLLCGCTSSALVEDQRVTVTTSRDVVNATGCKFVGNVAETSGGDGTAANTSAAEQAELEMQRDVSALGGNVLLLLSSKTGGYGSEVRATGEGYWCPGRG